MEMSELGRCAHALEGKCGCEAPCPFGYLIRQLDKHELRGIEELVKEIITNKRKNKFIPRLQ